MRMNANTLISDGVSSEQRAKGCDELMNAANELFEEVAQLMDRATQ